MQKLMQTLMQEHNVECVLLTKTHNLLSDWCNEQGIENYSYNYRDIMAGDSYESWFLNMAKHILKYIRYIRGGFTQKKIEKIGLDFSSIDLIHSNTNRVDIGAFISRKYNIPHIWHLREMDEGAKNMHYYMKNWTRYMNESGDCFIAITQAVKDSWVRHGLDEKKIRVIYNGIDPESIVIKTQPILQEKKIKIVSVGRIERAKGQMDIVNALCSMPVDVQRKFQLDFVGEAYADYKKLLIDKIKKSDCKTQINFKGYCKNVGEILQNYDIGITCSVAEAFGRTTIEYMMAGLLTIASDTGANKELIDNNKTGLIYSYGNSDKLQKLLCEINENQSMYATIAMAGRNAAIDRFNSHYNAEEIFACYKSLGI